MSFGYSVGDFVSLLKLTNHIRKRFVRAPVEFREISDDIKRLGVILQDIEDFESEQGLDERQKTTIEEMSQACQKVLTELKNELDKYQELDHEEENLGKRTRRVWKRLQWDQSKINGFRKRIDSNMILFNNVITGLNGNVILAMKDRLDRLCQHQADKKSQFILDWLAPSDYTSQQIDILRQREEGTGQWLLERNEFKSWSNSKQHTLFCLGIKGAGKTTLVSIIIDHLEQRFRTESDIGIAYIYFNHQSTRDASIQDLVASLVKQLIPRRSELSQVVIDLYKSHGRKSARPSTDELSSCLRSIVAKLSRTFIIVDALDECITDCGLPGKLLHEIFTLQAEYKINFLATSRHIPEIMAQFDRKTWLEIRADPNDVERYLNSHLPTFPSFLLKNRDLVNDIITKITESVDGMFLLAKLHLNSLRNKGSPKAIRTALGKLHTGSDAYDHSYKDAMQRIEQQGMEKEALAKNVLSWIICAKRPLTINELLHAVAVETSSTYFDEDNLSDIQYMISLCAGLVVVDEESGIVRLIHYTTQGYFERTWQTWFPKAHQNIAMVSLTYLSFDKFATGPCANWNEYRDRLKENPVYHYAARYWGYHAKQAYSEVKDHMNKIFQCDLTLASAAQVLCLEKGFGSCIDSAHKGVYGLHLAAWFGLDDKVKELLQEPRYHNLVDNKGQTVLHWAIRNSQTLTVELLIREGINVNVADKEGMTALHYAARQGNGQLIHLLVRNGAHLEIVDNNGWTPFLTAADCVKTASIAELLSYDTAINVVDTMNRNALHLVIIAAKDESAYLVNRLLSKGVCPISCDTENMTPLHYAVANGNPKIVESILEAGVDINYGIERKLWRKITKTRRSFYILDKLPEKTDARTRDAAGLTPLHFAACSGDWSMTAYLLKKGANPNARCSEGDTPLHIALRNGLVNEKYNDAWTDIEWKIESLKFTIDDLEDYAEVHRLIDEARLKVINMLLASTDIDVNIQNTQLDSPLHSMSIRTYSDTIVAELLQKGADPHKRNNKGQTALHLACKTDDLDAVNRLLNAGCSITTEDTEGLTALHYAVGANKYELAKLIFDRHPDAASKLCLAIGRPLLHHHLQSYICDLADLSDREHLMALLLDNGASVNSVDMNGDSPLSIYLRSFVVEDRTDICRFLLERDADPLWTNSRGQNLAHVAMHNWRAEVGVLEHLKMYGVDLSRKDRGAKSILHHGAIHGSISQELICVLQRYNIDGLDEKDMKDKSPLEYAEEAAKRKRDQDTFHPSGWRETWENLKQMKNHELMQCHSRDTTKDDRLE